jgi:hypothetical protein
VVSVFYLLQERRLKSKQAGTLLEKLPPLATLDNLISTSMGVGFGLFTLGVVVGITWAVRAIRHALDRRRQDYVFVVHLGPVPGDDFSSRNRGLERTQGRHHGAHGSRLLALTWAAHVGLRPTLLR